MGFLSLLRPERGSAMIQGMFLAAAVAGMAYVGTRLDVDQKLSQKGVESKGRTEQLHDMVYAILQNNSHCSHTLALNNATSDLTVTTPIALSAVATKDTLTLDQSPFRVLPPGVNDLSRVYVNNSVTIKNMTLTYPSDFADPAVVTVTYGRFDAKGTPRTGQGYGSKDVNKKILLKVQRNMGTGAFESCYAVTPGQNENMIKEFCENLGADADPSTPSLFEWNAAYQSCSLREMNCPSGLILRGFDANGNKNCRTLQDSMDLNDLFDNTTPVDVSNQTAQFQIVGQKVKIVTTACTPAIYSYSAWSTCASGTETRTVASCVGTCDGSCGSPVLSQPCSSNLSCVATMAKVAGANGCKNGDIYQIYNNGVDTGSTCTYYPDTDFYDGSVCAVDPSPNPTSDCPVGPGCPSVGGGPSGLADGAICTESGPGVDGGLPQCSTCTNAPSHVCGCGANPSTKGTCGGPSNCATWSMCF